MQVRVVLSVCLLGLVIAFGSLRVQHNRGSSQIMSGVMRPALDYRALGNIHEQHFLCQSNASSKKCYGVQQIRNAYNITPLLNKGITGKGRSIVILDAYQAPHLHHDLALFDQYFNLPTFPLDIIAPDGSIAWNANSALQSSWSGEISLDVEWAHAIAPEASIALVEAKTEDDANLISALNYAVDKNLGDIISMSFGEGENCVKPSLVAPWHAVFEAAVKKNITLLAASGDSGVAQQSCDSKTWDKDVSAPASDSLVTGIGGTTLDADAETGQYNGEVGWNEPTRQAGSGGGFSQFMARPYYQVQVSTAADKRGVPDVAYNASTLHGVLSIWSDGPKGLDAVYSVGGTSAGAPQWAAIVALLDQYSQRRVGFINPAIYQIGKTPILYHSSFHDVVLGTNTIDLTTDAKVLNHYRGYKAQTNWDPVTGFGSPIVSKLIPLLAVLTIPSGEDLWGYKGK